MNLCQAKFVLVCVLHLVVTAQLFTDEVQIGGSYIGGYRFVDRFDRGLNKFHSSVRTDYINYVEADSFRQMNSGEGYIRWGGPIGEKHYFGIRGGRYSIPHLNILEYRSDQVYQKYRLKFDFRFFLFTYQYIHYLKRNWFMEAGIGYGFIPVSYWSVKGRRVSRYLNTEVNAFHTGRFGIMSRMDAGVYRVFGEHFFVRMVVRGTYAYVGPFYGEVNDFGGNWYYLKDDGLSLLSVFDAALDVNVIDHPVEGPTRISFIREKAAVSAGLAELEFSIGVRIF